MPTGYTADVQSGKVTEFPEFAMQCARAFGALIMMRDESSKAPIPERFEPKTSYYDEALASAKARLAELLAMSPEAVTAAAEESHKDAVARWSARRAARAAERQRYEAMLAKVAAWEPPTPEHDGMKKFMADQLRESIKFDCSGDYDDEPVALAGPAWLEKETETARWDIGRYAKHRREEIARTEDRNKWLADLRASLASMAEAS
jgi:hypothetical protein